MHFSQKHVCMPRHHCFCIFHESSLVCVVKGICWTFAMRICQCSGTPRGFKLCWNIFFLLKRWYESHKHLMLEEGEEACLLFPMSLELSVEDAAMILWCQNYGGAERSLPEKTHDWVSRCCDELSSSRWVVQCSPSKKSSAVNILEDLLDLELLFSSVQGREWILHM